MGIFKKKYEVAKLPESKKPPLDTYIAYYLTSVLNLSKEAKEGKAKFSSYTALTKMKWMIEPENDEKKRQDKLINKCRKMGYSYIKSIGEGEEINWCQFSTLGYNVNENKSELEKLYINCDRDKVADISKKLMKTAKKQKLPISFKIAYEDGISDNYHRSEKIVIYTEKNEQKDAIVDILKNIDKKNKNIFNHDRTIPFMPKVEGAEFICSAEKQEKRRLCTF